MNNKKHPEPTVGAFVFNKDSRILLIKSAHTLGRFVEPGGHIEIGESIENALKREVKEETGLNIIVEDFLMVQESIFSDEYYKANHMIFLFYLCRTENDKVKIDNNEAKEFVWIEPEKALDLKLGKFTRKAVEKYLEDVK